jgi:hypothetical protein
VECVDSKNKVKKFLKATSGRTDDLKRNKIRLTSDSSTVTWMAKDN